MIYLGVLTFFMLLWCTVDAKNNTVTKCPTGGTPVLHMCQGGSVTQESVLLDFFYAHESSVEKCKCSVLIVAGKRFSFSEISAPGYNGCGTEIKLSRDLLGKDETHTITCLGGTTYTGLTSGETLTIALHKKVPPKDTRYCYRLDISNAPHPSMTVTCTEVTTTTTTTVTTTPTNATTATTTTPTTTTSTTLVTTTPTTTLTTSTTTESTTVPTTKLTTRTSTTTNVTTEATTKHTPEPFLEEKCLANADVLIGILGALTGITILYSILITILYFRRKPIQVQQPANHYAEVYEEIPAYLAPVTSNRRQKPLPEIPTGNKSAKPPPLPSSNLPTHYHQNHYQSEASFIRHINNRNSSHWNWTYDEKTEQERERDRTEYLMAF